MLMHAMCNVQRAMYNVCVCECNCRQKQKQEQDKEKNDEILYSPQDGRLSFEHG